MPRHRGAVGDNLMRQRRLADANGVSPRLTQSKERDEDRGSV